MQTKTMSIVEIVSSKTVGFLVALAVTFWIVPAIWGVTVGAESAIYVTGIYTGVAVIRSYLFRRMFNWIAERPYRVIRGKKYNWPPVFKV
jgi:hypothetical protein|tara:strand:- start:5254 stop:5523 length:270 start_codon:yes stop_codon:yes gene_type:complete